MGTSSPLLERKEEREAIEMDQSYRFERSRNKMLKMRSKRYSWREKDAERVESGDVDLSSRRR